MDSLKNTFIFHFQRKSFQRKSFQRKFTTLHPLSMSVSKKISHRENSHKPLHQLSQTAPPRCRSDNSTPTSTQTLTNPNNPNNLTQTFLYLMHLPGQRRCLQPPARSNPETEHLQDPTLNPSSYPPASQKSVSTFSCSKVSFPFNISSCGRGRRRRVNAQSQNKENSEETAGEEREE